MRRGLRLSYSGGTAFADAKVAAMAHVQLWLNNGQTIQMRVDDADAELVALKGRTGRFAGEFADLPGPVLGMVRVEAIVAVVVR